MLLYATDKMLNVVETNIGAIFCTNNSILAHRVYLLKIVLAVLVVVSKCIAVSPLDQFIQQRKGEFYFTCSVIIYNLKVLIYVIRSLF